MEPDFLDGEDPRVTIAWQRRQMANMEIIIVQLREKLHVLGQDQKRREANPDGGASQGDQNDL